MADHGTPLRMFEIINVLDGIILRESSSIISCFLLPLPIRKLTSDASSLLYDFVVETHTSIYTLH